MPTETPETRFDYDALDHETARSLRSQATSIKAAMKRSQNDIIEIGNRLLDVKEDLEQDDFQPWIASEFAMSHQTATRFMADYEALKTR